MGLDLWFRDDVARILDAVAESTGATAAALGGDPELAAVYQQGVADALRAVALGFGLPTVGRLGTGNGDKPAVVIYQERRRLPGG